MPPENVYGTIRQGTAVQIPKRSSGIEHNPMPLAQRAFHVRASKVTHSHKRRKWNLFRLDHVAGDLQDEVLILG